MLGDLEMAKTDEIKVIQLGLQEIAESLIHIGKVMVSMVRILTLEVLYLLRIK